MSEDTMDATAGLIARLQPTSTTPGARRQIQQFVAAVS